MLRLDILGQPGQRGRWAVSALLLLASALPVPARSATAPAPAATAPTPPPTTLERIRQSGHFKIGYRTDARPFAFKDESGKAAGYSVALGEKVADAVKVGLGLPTLDVDWVPLTAQDRFIAVQEGTVDLLCGPDTETIGRRQQAAFSIPVFPGGIGALLRSDAPPRLKEILSGQPQTAPAWRAQAGQLLQAQTFAVLGGTTAEAWLNGKLQDFQLTAKVTPVDGYDAAIQRVVSRKANVLFADRAILLDAVARNPSSSQLTVLDRFFTYEPVALAMGNGDEAFRLLVDRTLNQLYTSGEIRAVYSQWFGAPSADVLTFFRWNTRPE